MVYGLSTNPIQAIQQGIKPKIATTPTSTTPMPVKKIDMAAIGGYGGGFAGITKPTVGSQFLTPVGGANTAFVNMPQAVQQKIVQQAAAKNTPVAPTAPAAVNNGPSFSETVDTNKISQQSPIDLYADLKAGMPIDQVQTYYPEYAQNQALINDLKTDIDGGMPEVSIQQYYPELYAKATDTTKDTGIGTMGKASLNSPLDMGNVGESLINPIGKIGNLIAEATQKIGSFNFHENATTQLEKRVANLTQPELDKYQKEREAYKAQHPTLSKMYSKTVEGGNLVSQMRNIVTGNTKDRSEVDAFKDYVKEREKTYLDQFLSAGVKGPNTPTMLANIPGGIVKLAGGMASAITNPADTLAGLGKMLFTEEGRAEILKNYGDRDSFAKALETEPVQVASDMSMAVGMIAGVAKMGTNLAAKGATKLGMPVAAKGLTTATEALGKAKTAAGGVMTMGVEAPIAKGISALTKATEGIPVLGKVTKYAETMTKPLETAGKIAKPIIAKAAQLNPNINLSDPLMKEAKENPYTPEHLNAIHEATDGNMSLVQPSYKTEAVKKVGDEFIKPELDAKEETYREGGSLYQDIRKSNQIIDVAGLDAEAKAIAEKYPQSTLTTTDKRNIATALTKVDDIMKSHEAGTFNINTALDTRQSFDKDIDYNMASAKGNEAVKEIRRALDKKMKAQVAGLPETDALSSKMINQLKDFKRQLITKEGNINYQSLKTVNNLSKTDLARRLDEYVPGATDRIDAIDKAMKIAKKTKGMGLLGKIASKAIAGLAGTVIGGLRGAAIGLLLEGQVEGFLGKKLEGVNTKRVLKFFNELDPKAQERLAEIAKKIAENKKLTAYDKLLIEQARSKYNAKKPILDAELAGKKALAERLRVAEEKRLATPALPVKASESNLGTPRNPIVAKGAIGTPAEMTGRRRNTQGYNDAPVKGDMTKLGKVVETSHTGGGFPKHLVKIEGYKDFMPIEKIEGGIREQTKGMKPKSETIGDFTKEMAATAPTPMEAKADVGKMGIARTTAADAISEELGYKDFKSVDNQLLKSKIAVIARMKDRDKTMKAVDDLKASLSTKPGQNDKPIIAANSDTTSTTNGKQTNKGNEETTQGGKGEQISNNTKIADERMAKEHAEKVKTYQENEVPLATAETLVNKNMTKKFKESGVQKAEESLQKEVDDLKASLAKTDAERADWNDTRKEDLVGMVEHGKQQLEMTKKYQGEIYHSSMKNLNVVDIAGKRPVKMIELAWKSEGDAKVNVLLMDAPLGKVGVPKKVEAKKTETVAMPTKEVAMNKKPTVNVQQGDLFGKMEEKQAKIDKKVDEEIQKETPTMDKIFQDLEFKRLNEKYKETGDKADQKAMDDYVDQWREKNVLKSKEQIDQEAIDAHYEEIQADQARMEAERDYTTMPGEGKTIYKDKDITEYMDKFDKMIPSEKFNIENGYNKYDRALNKVRTAEGEAARKIKEEARIAEQDKRVAEAEEKAAKQEMKKQVAELFPTDQPKYKMYDEFVNDKVATMRKNIDSFQNAPLNYRTANRIRFEYRGKKTDAEIKDYYKLNAATMKEAYIKQVRADMKKGVQLTPEVISQFPELMKATSDYLRYLKGYGTSFANKSTMVEDTTFGMKIKSQDGKPILPAQKAEIEASVREFEKVHGDIQDILEKAGLTVSHTKGKMPFLTDGVGGLYHSGEKSISVGVKIAGQKIKAFAHELTHALDDLSGEMTREKYNFTGKYDKEMIHEATDKMNADRDYGMGYKHIDLKAKKTDTPEVAHQKKMMKMTLGKYRERPNEVFARLVEQYSAYKLGEASEMAKTFEDYTTSKGYWDKETFEKLAPKVEADIKRKLWNIRNPLDRRIAMGLISILGISAMFGVKKKDDQQA